MFEVAVLRLIEAERSGSAVALANPVPWCRVLLPSSPSILRQLNNVSAAAAVAKFQNSISRSWSLSNNLTGYLFDVFCPATVGNNAALPIREGTVRKKKTTASKAATELSAVFRLRDE